MYLAVFSALLCISSGATFIGHSLGTDPSGGRTLADSNEYPTSEETSKQVVLEPPLIKRGIDPLSIPTLVREPPLKRGDKRDSYVYPATSSQLSDRVPLREPPLKRSDDSMYVLVPDQDEEMREDYLDAEDPLLWSRQAVANLRQRLLSLDRPTKRHDSRLRALRQSTRLWR
ncbi:unnamed protein product [Heligmosomoides polygyrus]|uniref:CRF domain-containing protein n=1 Tax=Heligmosomoides polygyrus TaxID=6339 RepID=A0A183FN15_HELPZ|nr:unnamed protein product [Heligmosomoides polygyrus]